MENLMRAENIKWVFRIGEKFAEVTISDDLTIEELEVVKEMLTRLVDTRITELKIRRGNKLPLTADIDSLYPELSVRARSVLKRAGCDTIADVLSKSPSDLKRMRNMGKHTMEEILNRFREYGSFKEDEQPTVIEAEEG